MKLKIIGAVLVTAGLGGLISACVSGADTLPPESKSGFAYATPETKAMQEDNFNNPAMLWVGIGEDEWSKKEGSAGKSCADCHGNLDSSSTIGSGMYEINPVINSMRGAALKYPMFDAKTKKPLVMEARINRCRTDNMKAKAWKWESDQMMGMTTLVKMQSRGMKMRSTADFADDPLHDAWKKGKEFFYQRRGQMDMSCSNCHEDYPGTKIRANLLTQAQINGFPTYRLKWQKVGTIHRRYSGCNNNIRAQNYKRGSDEYTNLEVYMTWRSRGLPIETPSIRN